MLSLFALGLFTGLILGLSIYHYIQRLIALIFYLLWVISSAIAWTSVATALLFLVLLMFGL